ncbi:MAG: methyltransferase domain-containing protein, partial [Chitinophagaceae bacterium]|nr:methyltransferase domain-containing protein [Anaerolineae bacterium]
MTDHWNEAAIYETYVGRWSRLVAPEFLTWLNIPSGARWLDVGCGTGILSQTIVQQANPSEVKGVDRSAAFVELARDRVVDESVSFEVGDAQQLSLESSRYDAVVSGLVLNFIPDLPQALREMARVAKAGGVIAAYVWDYADQMQMMRHFWDSVIALHPDAVEFDQARRFPICKPEPLAELFQNTGLGQVEVRSIDVITHFVDFEDYWTPFLGGQGPAPSYVTALNEQERTELRHTIQTRLPIGSDGSIDLV